MNEQELHKWFNVLKDKNSKNVVVLYLDENSTFWYIVDDELVEATGSTFTKFMRMYLNGFERCIEKDEETMVESIKFGESKIDFAPCGCAIISWESYPKTPEEKVKSALEKIKDVQKTVGFWDKDKIIDFISELRDDMEK